MKNIIIYPNDSAKNLGIICQSNIIIIIIIECILY